MDDFSAWIGKRQVVEDVVSAGSVAGMNAMLDRRDAEPHDGDRLPLMWHWLFFAPRVRRSELGPDGHPARGGFLPPVPLPRRMFAGARYRFHKPLHVGETVRRETEIADVSHKTGKSGELVFVRLAHQIIGEAGPAIEEEHDIVYRAAAAPPSVPLPLKPDSRTPEWKETFTPDPIVLFRYSALTFNGHRIHYDRPYAIREEGYPGLVVHGPLIATLLIELVRAGAPGLDITGFRFRAKRPLFDVDPFVIAGGRDDDHEGFWLQAVDPQGAVAMEADGSFAPPGP